MGDFLQPAVEDKSRQRLVREIALIEGEWPAHTGSGIASGFCTPNAGTASILLSVPSAMWFKPRSWWIDNENAASAHLMIYAGGPAASCLATIGGLRVGGNETGLIGMDCVTVGNDLWIDCTVASCHVRVGGLLIASGPEN